MPDGTFYEMPVFDSGNHIRKTDPQQARTIADVYQLHILQYANRTIETLPMTDDAMAALQRERIETIKDIVSIPEIFLRTLPGTRLTDYNSIIQSLYSFAADPETYILREDRYSYYDYHLYCKTHKLDNLHYCAALPVSFLDLSNRLKNALKHQGRYWKDIKVIGDFLFMTNEETWRIMHAGQKSQDELLEKLKELNDNISKVKRRLQGDYPSCSLNAVNMFYYSLVESNSGVLVSADHAESYLEKLPRELLHMSYAEAIRKIFDKGSSYLIYPGQDYTIAEHFEKEEDLYQDRLYCFVRQMFAANVCDDAVRGLFKGKNGERDMRIVCSRASGKHFEEIANAETLTPGGIRTIISNAALEIERCIILQEMIIGAFFMEGAETLPAQKVYDYIYSRSENSKTACIIVFLLKFRKELEFMYGQRLRYDKKTDMFHFEYSGCI